jgi:hypothetical protein
MCTKEKKKKTEFLEKLIEHLNQLDPGIYSMFTKDMILYLSINIDDDDCIQIQSKNIKKRISLSKKFIRK